MALEAPGFVLREAQPRDQDELLTLARELDSINLPTDPKKLEMACARSTRSFRGRVRTRARAVYIFCAEEVASGRIVAASMIIGKHGTPEAPHYYLELSSDDRYSHSLRKMFRHPYLRLRYSMDGPTEIGGLIVTRAMRSHPERIGKQISWVRFLYLGRHPDRFEPEIVAEMLAPMHSDHGNLFWDHYGLRVTGLTFREADLLSTRDKEFIRALFPDAPLYTFLLPDEVREAIGTVGKNTQGAVLLLEQAGMKFLNHVDPFDAGPYYGAATVDLTPVKNRRVVMAIPGDSALERRRSYLVGVEDAQGFRAVRTDGETIDGEQIVVDPAVLEILKIKAASRVDIVTLP
jgi:arginine N-succinyltransferase